MRVARVSLVRIRDRENRKCIGLEVGACMELSKERNMSGVAGETWDRVAAGLELQGQVGLGE